MLLLSRAFFENSHFQRDHQRLSLQDLAGKAGLLHQDSSGVYSLLAMGVMAQAQLEQRLRRFLTDAGAVDQAPVQEAGPPPAEPGPQTRPTRGAEAGEGGCERPLASR